mmetsp:Transcript_30351/g.65483  ORF Transcript_30351/g.65483 Transcript_30351/m.65483 type:complete len:109 (-) Transcript_30351:152-478(-)
MLRTLIAAFLISSINLGRASSLQGMDFLDIDDLDFADGTVLGLQRGYTIHKKVPKSDRQDSSVPRKKEKVSTRKDDGPSQARSDPKLVRAPSDDIEKRASSIVRSEPG